MSSQSQIEANRKNAMKSTGPRTAEGKEASSQNALKHGLRTNRNVIKNENQEEYELFRDEMIADLSPDGAMEEMLAERIVSLSWRLKRAEHFQNALIDALIEHGLHDSVSCWHDNCARRAQKEAQENGNMDIVLGIVINKDFANARTLEQLLIYERRIESSLYRAIAELKKMKHIRKEQETETAWAEVHPTDTCTNEANLEETCDSGLVAHDSSSKSGLHISTNEANSFDTSALLSPVSAQYKIAPATENTKI